MDYKFDFTLPTDETVEEIIDVLRNQGSFDNLNSSAEFFLNSISSIPYFNCSYLYLLNKDTMEFEYYLSNPAQNPTKAMQIFDYLLESDAIGEAVETRLLKLNNHNPFESSFLINPLISIDNIVGILIINMKEFNDDIARNFYYAITLLSSYFAMVFEILILKMNEENTKQVIEQRIAERTIHILKGKAEMHEKFSDLRNNLTMALPHEIRTPIGMIMGNSDFLYNNLSALDKEDIIDIVTDIKDSSKRINNLFENYIYFANLELIAIDPIALEKLQNSSFGHYGSILEDFAHSVSNKYQRESDIKINLVNVPIQFSETHFTKLVTELLDNAFKYSDPGSPILIDSYELEGYLFISFIDHGRGMTQEQIQTFDAYIQFERLKYEQQGLGLGLAIVRRLVNLYNAELTIDSQYGEYTKVTIKIKIAEEEEFDFN